MRTLGFRIVWPAVLLLVLAWPLGALADATVSFYSHSWGVTPTGYVYFPHAFIVVDHRPPDGSPATRQSYGFTAKSADVVIATHHGEGEVVDADPRYTSRSKLHFSMVISEAQYGDLQRAIAAWRAVGGDSYDLDKRNCISFVAEMARSLGLSVADTGGRNPEAFLARVYQANTERLSLPGVAVTAVASAPATELAKP